MTTEFEIGRKWYCPLRQKRAKSPDEAQPNGFKKLEGHRRQVVTQLMS